MPCLSAKLSVLSVKNLIGVGVNNEHVEKAISYSRQDLAVDAGGVLVAAAVEVAGRVLVVAT